MALSEIHAQIFREELVGVDGLSEKRMLGGLCFLVHGNMLCGVHQGGAMARVGKALEAKALQLDGVTPLSFTGRPMGGMVDLSPTAIENKTTRRKVLRLARKFVEALPPKR
jgi:TfoX/Sxy family transcriptional regulator of competence genes